MGNISRYAFLERIQMILPDIHNLFLFPTFYKVLYSLLRKGLFQVIYLDFSPFLRSEYVVDIAIAKRQRLSFPRKICASLFFPKEQIDHEYIYSEGYYHCF